MMHISSKKKSVSIRKPAGYVTAKQPVDHWARPSKKLQAYRSYSAAYFHVYERCRHFRRG